jgi:hypothetical protein
MKPHPDILLCIREASRAAHRCRDAAQVAYLADRHLDASHWRNKKETWYSLKERGIVVLHRTGVLRYIGASPQGMGIYEYGEGGMSCFHSTLHPEGVERTPVANHPEILMVVAKAKTMGISEERVGVTLEGLSVDFCGYERSAAPRRAVTCWTCGQEGHISRDCVDLCDPWDDDPAYSAYAYAGR